MAARMRLALPATRTTETRPARESMGSPPAAMDAARVGFAELRASERRAKCSSVRMVGRTPRKTRSWRATAILRSTRAVRAAARDLLAATASAEIPTDSNKWSAWDRVLRPDAEGETESPSRAMAERTMLLLAMRVELRSSLLCSSCSFPFPFLSSPPRYRLCARRVEEVEARRERCEEAWGSSSSIHPYSASASSTASSATSRRSGSVLERR